jgi:hypothetical protein
VVTRAREILSGLESGTGLPNKDSVKTADVSMLSVPKETKKENKTSGNKNIEPEKIKDQIGFIQLNLGVDSNSLN